MFHEGGSFGHYFMLKTVTAKKAFVSEIVKENKQCY